MGGRKMSVTCEAKTSNKVRQISLINKIIEINHVNKRQHFDTIIDIYHTHHGQEIYRVHNNKHYSQFKEPQLFSTKTKCTLFDI